MGKTVALRQGNTILDVPEENAQAALAAGYEAVSDEELAKYDAKKSYEKEMGILAGPVAFAQGATEAVLSVPGLFSGQSGGELLSKAATIGGEEGDEAIAAEGLREGAKDNPNWHLGGQVAGSVLGTKGIGMGVKAAGQGAVGLSTRLAPMLSPGARTLARGVNKVGHVVGEVGDEIAGASRAWSPFNAGTRTAIRAGENSVQSLAMANEEAFIRNEGLSADMGTAAFAMGALMPVAFLGVSKTTGKVVGKVKDATRKGAQAFDQVFPPTNPAAGNVEGALFGGARGRSGAFTRMGDYFEEKSGEAFNAKMKMNTGFRFSIMGAVTGSLPLMMTGLIGDAAIEKFGPTLLGKALNTMAQMSRQAAASSARAAMGDVAAKGMARKSLGALIGGVPIVAKPFTRLELNDFWEEAMGLVDGYSKDQSRIATEVGTRYNNEAIEQPMFVQNVTVQSFGALQYLRSKMPPFRSVSMTQPALGTTIPAPADIERFGRHYRAAVNPWTLYSDIAHGNVTPEAVESVRTLYPSIYMDMQAEAANVLGNSKEPLTRRQRQTFETLFGGTGVIDPSRDVQFMVRQQQYVAMGGQPPDQAAAGGGGGKPGRASGNPTLSQQMRSPTDQAMMNIGNSGS